MTDTLKPALGGMVRALLSSYLPHAMGSSASVEVARVTDLETEIRYSVDLPGVMPRRFLVRLSEPI